MMPVSAPQPQPAIQQVSEPVAVSEEAERALLHHPEDAVIGPELGLGLRARRHGNILADIIAGEDFRFRPVAPAAVAGKDVFQGLVQGIGRDERRKLCRLRSPLYSSL